MAAASPLRKLEDELLCSICLDYLKDPVTINCGHIFCYHCIIKVCESAQQPLYCSLCKTAFKKENIRHVWQMASRVENIWRMKVDEERQPREDRPLAQRAEQLCGQHLEKLHYYCKDDQQILCVVCQESWEHRHHAAILLEKAAQPYQGKILNHLKILKGDRDRIQNFQSPGEDEIQALVDPSDMTSRYPWKKFWIEKPISPAIRKRIEEFSDKLLCLEKGLRGFHGKGRNSEPRKPSFFLCNVSLGFDRGCTISEFLHIIHTRQGH